MRKYFLKTTRIGFSHWTDADVTLAGALFGDPDVTHYVISGGRFGEEQILARLQLEMENDARYGVSYWPMFALDSAEFLGCCGLRPHDVEHNVYEMGYYLMRDQWGKGYAREAGKAIIAYGFNTLGAQKLIAGHHPDNISSGKVLLALGFRRTGAALYPPTGLLHPAYELTKEGHSNDANPTRPTLS